MPFENMIYLGDGPSDIPCFSMIQKLGGNSIAINSTDSWSKKWEYELRNRDMVAFEPDYSSGSKLIVRLGEIIKTLA